MQCGQGVLFMATIGSELEQELADLSERRARYTVVGKLFEQGLRELPLTRLCPELDLLQDQARAELAQLADLIVEVFVLREICDDLGEFLLRIAVALALEIEPHDFQPRVDVVLLDGGLENLLQQVTRECYWSPSACPTPWAAGTHQPFDLGEGRRDFGNALDDGERSVAALHFKGAAAEFVERLKRSAATDPADPRASFGDVLPDTDTDFSRRRAVEHLGHVPGMDERAAEAVVEHQQRQDRDFARGDFEFHRAFRHASHLDVIAFDHAAVLELHVGRLSLRRDG